MPIADNSAFLYFFGSKAAFIADVRLRRSRESIIFFKEVTKDLQMSDKRLRTKILLATTFFVPFFSRR
jgi:hypothetical protein